MVRAALAGALDDGAFRTRSGVRSRGARRGARTCRPRCSTPRSTWTDPAAYDAQARKLADDVPGELRAVRSQVPETVQRRDPGCGADGAERHPRVGACRFEIIRDPLWNNIRLDPLGAAALVDTPAVQRLRYVRQLGLAFLVYPGATHTRFEHALGAYHLTKRALAALEERGELAAPWPRTTALAVRLAALLHDVGHYPFSHALEEAGFPHHEELGVASSRQRRAGRQAAREIGGPDFAGAVGAAHPRRERQPAAGTHLRLARPRQDRVPEPRRPDVRRAVRRRWTWTGCSTRSRWSRPSSGRFEVGVQEKGVSALESLLFAKYQMYRNVYWHHAVRTRDLHVQAGRAAGGAARSAHRRKPSPKRPTTG